MTSSAEGPSDWSYIHSQNLYERYAEERAIDEWMPITSSTRNGKWWYSTVHNVTAMVGAGVLAIPFSLSQLGWGPGITVLILSWIITLYTLWQMVEMHEMVPGKRFDRYHELGQYAFGKKAGVWIVVPQQLIVQVGVDIVYMILGGQSLNQVYELILDDHKHDACKLKYCIIIFASIHFVLSQLPNFNSIAGISLAAAVMSISYSTIAWAASLMNREPKVQYDYKASSSVGTIFTSFGALGSIAFGYCGHNVVLEIQSTMPSTEQTPSKRPMWRGVVVAYIIVAACYFPVGIIGYYIFGKQVCENILIELDKPKWLIVMANLFVAIHLIGSYQIYAMPVYDFMEIVLVRKLKFKPSRFLRFVVRNTYVAFTMFMAITFPFFEALLSFFGGFAFIPTTYFLPCIMWLAIHKPKRFSVSWFTNWICITLGIVLTIVAVIGGLRKIIIEAKCYHFYSWKSTCSLACNATCSGRCS